MKSENRRSWLLVAASFLMVLAVPMVSAGCSFSPAKYFSRNACEFVNCDVLFFVDDVFPLSAGPAGGNGEEAAEGDGMEEMGH
ncbi:MAG: hypothetical protein IID40_06345 [Planctomycetes bacterium]|nr:hypothetical protein [Planctomycetota bacterium]